MLEDSFYFFSVEGVEFVIAADDDMPVEDLFPDCGRSGLNGLYALRQHTERIDRLMPSRAVVHVALVRCVHHGLTPSECLGVQCRRDDGITDEGVQLAEKEGLIPNIRYPCMENDCFRIFSAVIEDKVSYLADRCRQDKRFSVRPSG